MSEFVISTVQRTDPDTEICELTVTITDAGVKITAKSPIIAEFVATKAHGLVKGDSYASSFAGLTFYSLPSRYNQDINGNGIYPDLFFPNRNIEPGLPRGMAEPNLLWLRTKGLAEGVTLTFPQPAHIPADLIEYLNRSMEKTRVFYMKHIRKLSIKATLTEKVNG
jgi:hypothetical protein